ncbi:hypothetical protein [Bacillus kwashiorkori]|nr:hypothetical protein [Bacillus kwashiorkori]
MGTSIDHSRLEQLVQLLITITGKSNAKIIELEQRIAELEKAT